MGCQGCWDALLLLHCRWVQLYIHAKENLPKLIVNRGSTWQQFQEVQATCGCKALCLPQLSSAKTPASGKLAASAHVVLLTAAVLFSFKLKCRCKANAITVRLFYQGIRWSCHKTADISFMTNSDRTAAIAPK